MVVYALKEKLKIRDDSSTLPELDDMAFVKFIVNEQDSRQIMLSLSQLFFRDFIPKTAKMELPFFTNFYFVKATAHL